MRQNGHSQDITGRDEEDVPRFASKCMEYLESIKDAPLPQYLNRTARKCLHHNNIEPTVTGVTRSLQTNESNHLRT